MASLVPVSTSKPSTAANLIALRILSPSSENLSLASPTVLISLFAISFCPSNKSTSSPFILQAIAFIVKSLRPRSSSTLLAKLTLSGCLPSEYPDSLRKVVISTGSSSIKTVTVPCLSPVGITLKPEKTFMTSSGLAELVTSKSWTSLPIRMSLRLPPTI